jgi:2-phosphosulfolactate phosphatase
LLHSFDFGGWLICHQSLILITLVNFLKIVQVSVYHTPELAPADNLPDCAIAIDVLRATTTMVAALAAGAEGIQAFIDMPTLMANSESWPGSKRLRAGERGGSKVEGCDLGNSPLDCTPEMMGGKRLFMSTTNGTRTLEKIAGAKTVLAAALTNRSSVVDYLLKLNPKTVWIVGSGWEGTYALEDTVCAGAIIHSLNKQLGQVYGNDEAVAAESLYEQWQSNMVGLMHVASHGQRLLRLNCDADIEYCATLDSVPVVPIRTEGGVFRKL